MRGWLNCEGCIFDISHVFLAAGSNQEDVVQVHRHEMVWTKEETLASHFLCHLKAKAFPYHKMVHAHIHRTMMQIESPIAGMHMHVRRNLHATTMPRHLCFGTSPQQQQPRQALQVSCLRPTSTETTTTGKTQPIVGLTTEYCDDFVCTSSPAVESTIRTVVRNNEAHARGRYARCTIHHQQARDLKRATWTPFCFSRDVKYSDTLRSFSGSEGYLRNRFVADCVEKPKARLPTRLFNCMHATASQRPLRYQS